MGLLWDTPEERARKEREVARQGLMGTAPQEQIIAPMGGDDSRLNIQLQGAQEGTGFLGSDKGLEAQQDLTGGLLAAGYTPQQIGGGILDPIKQQGEMQRQGMLDQLKISKEMTEQSFKQGNVLRKERGDNLKPFVEAKTQYNTTMNSLKQGNSAGALAAIFSFMKTLDPRSVVREGEFDMAASTGGVVDSLVGMVNKAKGEGMGAVARKNIAETIQAIMEGRVADAETISARYDLIAEEQGVPKSQIRTGSYNPELQGVPDNFVITEGGVQWEYRTDPKTGKQQRRKK